MTQYTITVDGMQCGMCESHVNDAVRRAFHVKKVESSHGKNRTRILAEEPLDEAALERRVAEKVPAVQFKAKEEVAPKRRQNVKISLFYAFSYLFYLRFFRSFYNLLLFFAFIKALSPPVTV